MSPARWSGRRSPSWTGFARGFKLVGWQGVQDYGVTATVTIAQAPTSYRKRLIKNVRRWFDERKRKPSHEVVARYVWRRRRELAPEEFVSRARLTNHIDQLRAKLRKHGIRPPRMKKG